MVNEIEWSHALQRVLEGPPPESGTIVLSDEFCVLSSLSRMVDLSVGTFEMPAAGKLAQHSATKKDVVLRVLEWAEGEGWLSRSADGDFLLAIPVAYDERDYAMSCSLCSGEFMVAARDVARVGFCPFCGRPI